MLEVKELHDSLIAQKVGDFLIGTEAFEHDWAPKEKEFVRLSPIESVGKQNHRYWYIEDKGQIVGAMGVRENKYGSGGYEMNEDYMAVHKNYRKQGFAGNLLKAVEEFVKKNKGRYIHILSCDTDLYGPSRAFYEKHGYRKVAEIPDYYVKGEGRIDYFKEI